MLPPDPVFKNVTSRHTRLVYDFIIDSLVVRTLSASEFKAKCLKLMDEVEDTRVPIMVAERGRPWHAWSR